MTQAAEAGFSALGEAATSGLAGTNDRLSLLWAPEETPGPGAGAGQVEMPAMGGGGQQIIIHPFGREFRPGTEDILPFPEAAAAAAERIGAIDAGGFANGEIEAMAIAVAQTSMTGLAESLSGITAVFPIPALQQLQRRAQATADNEASKWTRPTANKAPDGAPMPLDRLPAMAAMGAALRERWALSDGYSMQNRSPADRLAEMAQRKTDRIAKLAQQYDDLIAAFSGGSGFMRHMSGTPEKVAWEIAHNTLGKKYTLTVLAVFTGAQGEMTALTEILGIQDQA